MAATVASGGSDGRSSNSLTISSQSNAPVSLPEETYLGALTYQTVLAPVLAQLDKQENGRVQCRRICEAMQKCDSSAPGFLFRFVQTILDKSEVHCNVQEAYLRLQAVAPPGDLALSHPDHPEYADLSAQALALRKVLARVPDEMSDRRTFLETIKEIASSIKRLLDATNMVQKVVPVEAQQSVERRRKEFVHYSKRFSNTLKEYFKGDDANQVFVSANQLIFYTTCIVRTVRDKTQQYKR